MRAWYFAYGSNLCVEQMARRIGSIGDPDHPPRIVRLPNHRLIFRHVESGGPAFASIVSPGSGVMGVIYRLSEPEFEILDRFETGYERRRMIVIDMWGEFIEAFVYVVESRLGEVEGEPDASYLARIVNGAKRHALPDSYIQKIVAISGTRPLTDE